MQVTGLQPAASTLVGEIARNPGEKKTFLKLERRKDLYQAPLRPFEIKVYEKALVLFARPRKKTSINSSS